MSWLLPEGDRGIFFTSNNNVGLGGVSVINQQMRNLDDYFVQMSLAYVEFKVHVSVLSTHLKDSQDGLNSFQDEHGKPFLLSF